LLKRFPVPLPDADTQRAITHQLDAVDARFVAEQREQERLDVLFESAASEYYRGVVDSRNGKRR
jgi:restriction endonuclease S subunit